MTPSGPEARSAAIPVRAFLRESAGVARHCVRHHVRVEVDAYGEANRRFMPGYEALLDAAAVEVARVDPGHVLDLGGGTGPLSQVILLAAPEATVELIDVDGEMLAVARERRRRCRGRAHFREASFGDPVPGADAVAASPALHHVATMDEKAQAASSLWKKSRGVRAAMHPA